MYSYDYECADYQYDDYESDYVEQINIASAHIIIALAEDAKKRLDQNIAVLVKMKLDSMFTRTLGLMLQTEVKDSTVFDKAISLICDYLDVTVAYAHQKTRDQYDSVISAAIDEKVKLVFAYTEEREALEDVLDNIIALKASIDYDRDSYGDLKYDYKA